VLVWLVVRVGRCSRFVCVALESYTPRRGHMQGLAGVGWSGGAGA
jgi:hypothetical protein